MLTRVLSIGLLTALIPLLSACAKKSDPLLVVRGVVQIVQGKSKGSGSLVTLQGCSLPVLLTNKHVVPRARPVKVSLPISGLHVWVDSLVPLNASGRDLAVLALTQDQARRLMSSADVHMPIRGRGQADSSFARQNQQPLVALGYSIRSRSQSPTLRSGVVLKSLPVPLRGGYDLLVTHALDQGMSGGPLFDANHRLIGINALHGSPAWDHDLYYENGALVASRDQRQVESLAMAISSQTIVDTLLASKSFVCVE